jgi:ATP-dependent DNA ligase
VALAERVLSGELEGVVLKDRQAPYRSGSRRGWAKVKAPDWNEKHRERFRR